MTAPIFGTIIQDLLNAQGAVTTARSEAEKINGSVVDAMGVVSKGWVSSASTAYTDGLNAWTGEYRLITQTLDRIGNMLGVTADLSKKTNEQNLEHATAITSALRGRG